jgi:non-specific serine/threonine protein kinase
VEALFGLGMALGFGGEVDQAVKWHQQCLTLLEPRQEYWYRGYVLWLLGLDTWQEGALERATSLVKDALRLQAKVGDPLGFALCFEVLAGLSATENRLDRTATLLGATDTLWHTLDMPDTPLSVVSTLHEQSLALARDGLGDRGFDASFQRGAQLAVSEAIAFALETDGGRKAKATPKVSTTSLLTPRQTEIAELIAEGLGNRQIANRLFISQRTAEGHVEQILTKLGFTSRAQIAAWVAEARAERSTDDPGGRSGARSGG